MRPRVAIVTFMRNEGPHLMEWIAHHRAAGANDILVYTNDCTDGSDALLDLLAEDGAIVHRRNTVPAGQAPQWAALTDAAGRPPLSQADWIAVLDCDEFVNLRAPLDSMQDLIAACPDADAIALPWRLFGHSGHITRPAAPTASAYTRAIPPDALYPPLARHIKTLWRREGPFTAPGIHRPKQSVGAKPLWVDGSGALLPDSFAAKPARVLLWGDPLATEMVQLNHYALRSVEDFLAKRRRGLPNRTDKPLGLAYWIERNFNAVDETSIARMGPATAAELDRLRARPGVAAAEAASLAWHRAAFAEALKDRDTIALFGQLLMASGSAVPTEETAHKLVALWRAGVSAS